MDTWSIFTGFGIDELKNRDGDRVLSFEGYRLGVGKRWSLGFINIPNISIEVDLIADFGHVVSDIVSSAYNGYETKYFPTFKFQFFF